MGQRINTPLEAPNGWGRHAEPAIRAHSWARGGVPKRAPPVATRAAPNLPSEDRSTAERGPPLDLTLRHIPGVTY
jgi:hypothetical protein